MLTSQETCRAEPLLYNQNKPPDLLCFLVFASMLPVAAVNPCDRPSAL